MKFQKAYQKTVRNQINTGKGLTEQAHKRECDINFILRDYKRTGFIRHATKNKGRYDDIGVLDFQEAMFIVAEANSMFESLPGQVRKEFKNDPGRFLEFVQNPDNKDRMAKMGILKGNDGFDMKGMPTKAPVEPNETQNDSPSTPSAGAQPA